MFPRVDGLRAMEFGTPGPFRTNLVDQVLHGNKRATAGLLSEYAAEGEPLEHVGELLAMVDDATEAHLVLDRHKRKLMCHALANLDGKWWVQPMFIEPMAPQAQPYACKGLEGQDGKPMEADLQPR